MIITVKILTCQPLERLFYCEVTDGTNNYFVLSGGQNTRKDLITLLALPGTVLKNTTLTEKTILGRKSHGMLCSPYDLSLREEHGLIDLPLNTPLGISFESLKKEDLSSTPWYLYHLVENFYLNKNKVINQEEGDLLSQTYYFEGQYFYRFIT